MDLKRLGPQYRSLLTVDFLLGRADLGPDLAAHIKDFQRPAGFRKPDVEPLVNIVRKAMEKYDGSRIRRIESDGWLAPRVHAVLRLTRREAADADVWNHLAAVHLHEYVRWRWADDETREVKAERYLCDARYNKHAVARLWWGAELTRNGSDYTPTKHLFVNQDVQNSWFTSRFFRHRPCALASLRLLSTFDGGKFAGSDTVRDLVKSFNMSLTTTMLDAVSPTLDTDAEIVRGWCDEAVDETALFDAVPEGPPESAVDEVHVAAVTELLKRVVSRTRFEKRVRKAAEV